MESVEDCSKNNQNNAKRLYYRHGESVDGIIELGESIDKKHVNNWPPEDDSRWMDAMHYNYNNNSLEQHCDKRLKKSTSVCVSGSDYTVINNETNWSNEATQKVKNWNCEKCLIAASTSMPSNTNSPITASLVVDNITKMHSNGTSRALSKLAALVIHDAPASPTPAGACCIDDHHHLDYESEEDDGVSLKGCNIDVDTDGAATVENSARQSDETGAAACAATHSNRTSINNSTENLSYSSDNYFPNDLLLLEDNDIEPEEISLNSDDCIYAYRGDGAEFDIALDVLSRRGGGLGGILDDNNSGTVDDETDFLEMDFEPDPLSEAEYAGNNFSDLNLYADTFLLQRNSCHLSGRHSAANMIATPPVVLIRQHLSSPINAEVPPPLISKPLVDKNIDCINLHLDQINESNAANSSNLINNSGGGGASGILNERILAHSLPNMLHERFAAAANVIENENQHHLLISSEDEITTSVATTKKAATKLKKVLTTTITTKTTTTTGAKPKRYSLISNASSSSSKNSSKCRASRSAMSVVPCYGGSTSFDERSLSCNEFRSAVPLETIPPSAPVTSIIAKQSTTDSENIACTTTMPFVGPLEEHYTEEGCLDCLEKEFLANTIGKDLEPWSECNKCRRGHSNSSIQLYRKIEKTTSPVSFYYEQHAKLLHTNEFLCETTLQQHINKDNIDWHSKTPLNEDNYYNNNNHSSSCSSNSQLPDYQQQPQQQRTFDAMILELNQRTLSAASNIQNDKKLLTKILLTEPQQYVKISTANLSEEILVQALDKLKIIYNKQLVNSYFTSNSNINHNSPNKNFKNLKNFLLHASKQTVGNHKTLKRLIEMATNKKAIVKLQLKHEKANEMEMVPVKVSDILYQWTRHKDLAILQELGQRFAEANVIGKIANIIRQTEQRCVMRQPLPEFITIPQYYSCCELIISKNI